LQDQQDSNPSHDLPIGAWFGVRCVFGHSVKEEGRLYEERILLIRAASLDQAIIKAEQEAKAYAVGLDGVTYLDFAQAYQIFDDSISDRSEVFSLIRASTLSSQEYLSQYFDTGAELEGKSE